MLHTLPKLTTRRLKRLGRGFGSGVGGHTVGRGTKGHTARQGKSTPLWFEGGQLPLIRRLPFWRGKFRFKSLATPIQEVALTRLAKLKGTEVTPETLMAASLIESTHHTIKLIGGNNLIRAYTVRGCKLTNSARTAIEAAGGKIQE